MWSTGLSLGSVDQGNMQVPRNELHIWVYSSEDKLELEKEISERSGQGWQLRFLQDPRLTPHIEES